MIGEQDHISYDRYSRQMRFSPIGIVGQQRLAKSHVLMVGAGALGSASAESLVRAGVGRITIIDRDYVEWSNLQRQQLYTEEDVKQRLPKAIAAKRHLEHIHADAEIDAYVLDARGEDLERLIGDVDLIMDACDNFETRFILNDLAVKYRIPWIYGACSGSYGLSYTILPGVTPCLRCMMDLIPGSGDSCDTDGIIVPAVQMVVAHQTAEALKLLTGNREALRRKLVSFDLWNNHYSAVQIQSMKKRDCPSCGEHAVYPYLQASTAEKAAILCGRDTVHIRPAEALKLNLVQLSERIGHDHALPMRIDLINDFLISAHQEELRIVLFVDGRALVHGTTDVSIARQLYKQLMDLNV
ncbi:ThiF family adenylyltransferase [Paenibacillus guangzhouensis]|uniref:ThiF family adenylyltransferase n=1 Tax=Paenibacillus guangzhouensis TaxID=1473112 RepID=UPI0012668CB5|nr:ThiF family adenylyltransferase [Paenibacillus guangzhouensis]